MIAIGGWEIAAFSTHRLPTVSVCVWRGVGCRHKRIVQLAVVAYFAGAARHLLTPH